MVQLDFSALNDLTNISEEETVYLLLRLCENLKMPSSSFLDGISKDKLSRIYDLVQQSISYWIGMISNSLHGDLSSLQLEQSRLALLWGTVKCYTYLFNGQENLTLLLDLVNAIDELLMTESGINFLLLFISIYSTPMRDSMVHDITLILVHFQCKTIFVQAHLDLCHATCFKIRYIYVKLLNLLM